MKQEDLDFSNRFLDRVKSLVGPQILVKTSFEADTTEAADLTTLKDRQVRVAVRIRRPSAYKWPYWNQITLRNSSRSGSLSEVDKIVSGLGDLLFYGFSRDERSDELSRWFLIDLFKLRLHYNQCLKNPKSLERDYGIVRREGSEDFIWFDITKFPAGVVIDAKVTTYSLPLPKPKGLFGALPVIQMRRRIYERMTTLLDFYELRIEHEVTASELLQRLGSRVPKGYSLEGLAPDSKLYNVVTYSANGVPLFAIQERPMLNHIPEGWHAADLLATQVRLGVYQKLGLPALEWSTAMNENSIGEFVVESFLIDRISKNPTSPFAIERPEFHLEPLTIKNSSGASRTFYDFVHVGDFDFESDLKEDGALGVEFWKPVHDVDGASVSLCIIHLSDEDSVFGVGRCQDFDFPPTRPPAISMHLAQQNAGQRAYGVWKGESGSDKPEALEAWRERMRNLGSSPNPD